MANSMRHDAKALEHLDVRPAPHLLGKQDDVLQVRALTCHVITKRFASKNGDLNAGKECR